MYHHFRISISVSLVALSAIAALAQTPDGQQTSNEKDSEAGRTASLRTFVPDILEDQRRTFATFPSELVHGKHLLPVIAVCGLTAGLIAADQYDARFFRNNTATVRFNSAFSSTNTDLGIILAPAAFYSAGLFTKNEYVKETGLLSAEAAIDGEIADVAMKSISNRVRPRDISPSGNYSDSFFEGPHQLDGSFPSGHTVGAFAVATVVARRYGHTHRWVPFVAYALATSVGFSRVTESAHFPSDVFFGAAVGYAIARFEVLRH